MTDWVTIGSAVITALLGLGAALKDVVTGILTDTGLINIIPPALAQLIGTGVNFALIIMTFLTVKKNAMALLFIGGVLIVAFVINIFGILSYVKGVGIFT